MEGYYEVCTYRKWNKYTIWWNCIFKLLYFGKNKVKIGGYAKLFDNSITGEDIL